MNQIKLFIELTRINKPIGYMLLFWPCSWGLIIGYNFRDENNLLYLYLTFFLIGSILMRSAGCIINDIADRQFDIKVDRTKNRPIATGKVTVINGYLLSGFLCLLALVVLINFNHLTILLALGSMPLAFTYPLMKRFTYWPQLFLGITFNYGLILGWTSINNEINLVPLIFYFGSIFWTIGYDTIYGFQDIKDDEIIGLKSTSIKFKKIPHFFMNICYSIFFLSLITVGYLMKLNIFYFIFLIVILLQMFYFQIKQLDISKPLKCLTIFKSNNLLGLLIFISLLIGKI